ncbi:MAG: flagellar hook-basal body complex protein FliE [Deltaproteobacteria bacterium]|nr:flagellar hook-basal body complex protein FliE [Deltaproteobacteria bacterium]
MPIGNITMTPEFGAIQPGAAARPRESGFSELFTDYLAKANATMKQAESMDAAFAAGETNNIHETMLAVEESAISLRLVGAIRNRLLDSYHEIMRMSV